MPHDLTPAYATITDLLARAAATDHTDTRLVCLTLAMQHLLEGLQMLDQRLLQKETP